VIKINTRNRKQTKLQSSVVCNTSNTMATSLWRHQHPTNSAFHSSASLPSWNHERLP